MPRTGLYFIKSELLLQRRNPGCWIQKKETLMSRTSSCLTTAILVVALPGAAIAQTPVTPPATKSAPATSAKDTSQPLLSTQVETWTKDQWEAAKREWAKEKTKWADCQKRSDKQKLEDRKSWPFLYKCMTN